MVTEPPLSDWSLEAAKCIEHEFVLNLANAMDLDTNHPMVKEMARIMDRCWWDDIRKKTEAARAAYEEGDCLTGEEFMMELAYRNVLPARDDIGEMEM